MSVADYCAKIARQNPPYIKFDCKGQGFMEYVIPAGFIFTFHRIKWHPQTGYNHIALKLGRGYNKGLDTDWIELICTNGHNEPVPKKSNYVCEFKPEDFSKIEFEQVV